MDITSRGKSNYSPRILQYRKQVRIAAAYLKYVSYIPLVIFIGTLVSFIVSVFSGRTSAELLTGAFASWIMWLIYTLEYNLLLRPLAISKIQVYEDRIFIKRDNKEINIFFDEIVEIRSALNRNVGGWFKIVLDNKKKYRFSVVLERVDYVLDEIIKYNPELLSQKDYLRLRKQLVLSDHGLGRMYDMFSKKYRLITLFHAIVLPLVFVIILYFKQHSQFIIITPIIHIVKISLLIFLFFISTWIIFPIIMNRIIDRKMMKKMEENIDDKVRDTDYEIKVYRRLFPVYLSFLFLFFTAICVTDINTLGTTTIAKDSKYLDILADELLWLDSRYNCIDCNYSLIKGDVVHSYIGVLKIVARYVPGR